jgi:hypothetical protein
MEEETVEEEEEEVEEEEEEEEEEDDVDKRESREPVRDESAGGSMREAMARKELARDWEEEWEGGVGGPSECASKNIISCVW